jgi:ribonuclease HII
MALKTEIQYIIGLDEAGRGSLAGPVVAAATMLKISNFQFPIFNQFFNFQFLNIKESKKLTPKTREQFYKIITTNPAIKWGRGMVSAKVIDRINIWEATKLAMRRAVSNLEKKVGNGFSVQNTVLIIDGNQKINSGFKEFTVVKGDEKIFLCSVASIIAKVQRDKLMIKYHKEISEYNFLKHKGYSTKEHKENIKKYSLSGLHRKTFHYSL